MKRKIYPFSRVGNNNRILYPFHDRLSSMSVKRSDAQKNRARLLSVARTMVHEGQKVPSFNVLAKRAGVGVGTVYRHFKDNKELLAGLAEAQLAELEALAVRVGAVKDPLVALELFLRGTVALELKSPVIAQLIASPQSESLKFAQLISALDAVAEVILARGRRAKVIRSDLSVDDLHRLVCGLDLAVRSGDKPAEAATRYVDIVLAGLRRPL
jgi:AcrR family transcriptional regulator